MFVKSDYKYGIVDTGESNKNEHVYFIRRMRRGMLWPPYRRPPKSHNLLNTTNIIVLVTRYEQCFGHCTATQCCRKLFFCTLLLGGGLSFSGKFVTALTWKRTYVLIITFTITFILVATFYFFLKREERVKHYYQCWPVCMYYKI